MFFGFGFRRVPGAGVSSPLLIPSFLSLLLAILSLASVLGGVVSPCFAGEANGSHGAGGAACAIGKGDALPAPEIFDGKTLFRLGWGDDLCAVTFDDGPGRHTLRLLEILGGRGIPATFFIVGSRAEQYPAIIRRIQDQGHEVANHTFSHMTLRGRDPLTQRQEMERVQKFLADLGVVSRFVRPPYGRYDAETVRIAADLGLSIVLWAVDSMDWEQPPRMEHMRMQVRGQKARGIFLFHDTHALTVEAMPQVLDSLAADGCRFVTVSAYLNAVRKPPRSIVRTALSLPVRSSDAGQHIVSGLSAALSGAAMLHPLFRVSVEKFFVSLMPPAGAPVRAFCD